MQTEVVKGEHNPSFEGSWVDRRGQTWTRKGKRGRVLEERRVRSLLRREDVPLVVWQSFETTRHDAVAAKASAVDALGGLGQLRKDVVASEWLADGGQTLLMLEIHC